MATDNIFKAVFESAPIGILLVDASGQVIEANAEACSLFGHASLVGKPIEALLPERFRTTHRALRAGFAQRPEKRSMGGDRTLYGLCRDGSEFPIEVGLNPITTETGIVTIATVADITLRRQHEEQFRIALESSPIGAIAVDQSGHIMIVNQQTEAIFGYARDELVGQPVEVLLPARFRSRHPEHRASFLGDPKTRMMGANRELKGRRKDGTEVPIEIGLSPVETAAGLVTIASVADITVRRRMEEELKTAMQRSRAANLAKSQFLANMSHELRTPLNQILGTTELLLRSKVDADQTELLQMLMQSGQDLTSTLQSLLDVAALDEATGQNPVPTDLGELVSEAVEQLAEHANTKGLQMRVDVASDVPMVIVDPDPLRQSIALLVDNAIKFTDRGSVTVQISAERADGGDDSKLRVNIDVVDTGIGIHPDDQVRIFEPFETVDASSTRRFGGSGLGLTICSRLVSDLGGQVQVESEPSFGSTFRISILLDRHVERAVRAGGVVRILLVHDNPIIQRMIATTVARSGHRLTVVGLGADAIDIPATETFDLTIADFHLPDMDALEFAHRIGRAPGGSDRYGWLLVLADQLEVDDAALSTAGIDERQESFTVPGLERAIEQAAVPR